MKRKKPYDYGATIEIPRSEDFPSALTKKDIEWCFRTAMEATHAQLVIALMKKNKHNTRSELLA